VPAGRSHGRTASVPWLHPGRGSQRDGAGLRRRRIAHFHPDDLRHRYASVKIAEGVPVTDLAAQLGHSRKSLTLDTYSHVLVD
jgi:integrase